MEYLKHYREYSRTLRGLGIRGLSRVRITDPSESKAIGRSLRSSRPLLIADENTAHAGADEIGSLAPGANRMVFPGSPRLVPDITIAQQIAETASAGGHELILCVGGGTLCDLSKYAAEVANVPLVMVPACASVDAYNSPRSALRIDGYHRTPQCRLPSLILVDSALLQRAPENLTLSGIGDLVAKLFARLDWQVADWVKGETIFARETEWCAKVARNSLAWLGRHTVAESATVGLDALLVTGLSMQIVGSSRPGASTEHTLAHLWEVAVNWQADQCDYHGILVVAASRIVLKAYRWILDRLASGASDGRSSGDLAQEDETWRERLPEAMRPYVGKMEEEAGARRLDQRTIDARRERIISRSSEILGLGESILSDVQRGLDALDRAGIQSYTPEVPAVWQESAVKWVRFLRNRYSLFDVAWEMGWQDDLTDRLFEQARPPAGPV